MTTPAEKYAALLNREVGRLKFGSLCFWGVWFGKPYDNQHRITGADGQADLLHVGFDGGELLSVWSPVGLEASTSIFQIAAADRVRWEWYYYGRPQTPENLYFEDYLRGQAGKTNANWYQPNLIPVSGSPAVAMY